MEHNKILGVGSDATTGEINKAFRAAAMEIHPDHSSAPEAAVDFDRIREARDRLIEEAKRNEIASDAASIQSATARAVKATEDAAYGASSATTSAAANAADDLTPEEIAHIQELDRLANLYARKSKLARRGESPEVRSHRRRIATANRRIDGKY